MTQIRQYILSAVAAALLCSILRGSLGKTARFSALIDIVCGLFIAFILFAPLIDIDLNVIDFALADSFQMGAQDAVEEGEETAQAAVLSIIKEQTQAYILDKADSLGMNISVEVEIDQDTNIPNGAIIHGTVSPYEKTMFCQYMEASLGIPEANQQWE